MKRSSGGFRGAWALCFAVLIGWAALQAGCSAPGEDVREVRWQANELCRGLHQLAHGYKEAARAEEALENGQDDKAHRHFEKAEAHYLTAVDHFNKAQLSPEQAKTYDQVVSMLEKGTAQLDHAQIAIQAGNADKAEEHFDQAVEHFNQAIELVND